MGCGRWVGVLALLALGAVFGVTFFVPSSEDAVVFSGPPSYADVLFVRAEETAPQTWTFYVTVSHPDTGWEHYADGWDVLLPDGTALKPQPDAAFTRVLAHPHVDEQPFTRSQARIVIPADVGQVRVRAHDLLHGWGGREVLVNLNAPAGEGFEVQRLASGS